MSPLLYLVRKHLMRWRTDSPWAVQESPVHWGGGIANINREWRQSWWGWAWVPFHIHQKMSKSSKPWLSIFWSSKNYLLFCQNIYGIHYWKKNTQGASFHWRWCANSALAMCPWVTQSSLQIRPKSSPTWVLLKVGQWNCLYLMTIHCGRFAVLSLITECVVNRTVNLVETWHLAINAEPSTINKSGKMAYTILMTG